MACAGVTAQPTCAGPRAGRDREKGWAVTPAQAMGLVGQPNVALVDLRERSEREKHG